MDVNHDWMDKAYWTKCLKDTSDVWCILKLNSVY
jgi:hypothetical protein